MENLVESFANERGTDVGETDENGKQELVHLFPYAFRCIRIGEEIEDVEIYTADTGNVALVDELIDRLNIQREIETAF
jgi:hypothetical protein